jgi:hypothetical protein
MNLPFTVEQFFDVFQIYNTAIWPVQIVAYVLGIVALGMALRPSSVSSRIVSTILAVFWVWMGVFYHLIYYSHINSAAWIFGLLYVLEGGLFLAFGTFRGKLSFEFRYQPLPIIGACFILYAMVIYPLLGISLGHAYPRAPMFGVAPCPTTIFTFGLLLWVVDAVPVYLLIIPLLWSFLGVSAAINLQVPQDYGLVVAGVLGTALILMQNRKAKKLSHQFNVV